MREFKRRLDVWSAGTNLFSLLDTLPNDLKVRGSAKGQSVGPKTILRYVKLLAEMPRGNMVQVRLTGDTPTLSNGASVVTVSPLGDPRGRRRVPEPQSRPSRRPSRAASAARSWAAPRPAKKKHHGPKPIPPAKLRVVTVNGSGVQSVATAGQGRAPEGRLAAHLRRRHPAADEPLLDARLLHEPPRATPRPRSCGVAGRHHRLRAPARGDERLRARTPTSSWRSAAHSRA